MSLEFFCHSVSNRIAQRQTVAHLAAWRCNNQNTLSNVKTLNVNCQHVNKCLGRGSLGSFKKFVLQFLSVKQDSYRKAK